MKRLLLSAIFCLVVASLVGCAHTSTARNPQPPVQTQAATLSSDIIDEVVQRWLESMLQFGPVATATEPPLVGYCGVKSLCREHLEMGLFDRAIEFYGPRTGKLRLVMANKETATATGKNSAWKYAIYGEVSSMKETDAKGNAVVYYDICVYMKDTATGELVWNSRERLSVDIKRGNTGR
jgi:PBP1b-binding outer membrane lipoprotein LpoB